MDVTAHYRNLVALGRDEFLASAAAAVLVRHRVGGEDLADGATTLTIDQPEAAEETLPHGRDFSASDDVEIDIFPLTKKPGASFPDRITLGRTPNNDVVVADHSVSRFHAYVRRDGGSWMVADAGSKNGSWLGGKTLEARKERKLPSGAVLRIGDVDLTFYEALDLYAALGGR